MDLPDLVLLPMNLLHRGLGGVILGIGLLVIYAALVFIVLKVTYWVANLWGVKRSVGTATVVAKRTISAHRELQGRFPVNVPEQYVVDLDVKGQKVTYTPPKWTFDETVAAANEPVEYLVGRIDGAVRITRFKHL